jgi:GAF domain-containing protein
VAAAVGNDIRSSLVGSTLMPTSGRERVAGFCSDAGVSYTLLEFLGGDRLSVAAAVTHARAERHQQQQQQQQQLPSCCCLLVRTT